MTDDEKINIILNSLVDGSIVPMYDWIERELDEHDRQSERNHRILIDRMVEENLIKKMSTDKREVYAITANGKNVVIKGGWLKHLIVKMTEEQKIHRLLEYMAITDEYHWTPETLKPAFGDSLNENEIEYLCQILINNGDVNDNRSKDGFAIGFDQKSKSVFHGKKYLKEVKQPVISITTGDIGTIQKNYGTVQGAMNQSPDLSQNKTTIKTNKADSSIAKKLVIGVVVGLVVALILYYFFGIK